MPESFVALASWIKPLPTAAYRAQLVPRGPKHENALSLGLSASIGVSTHATYLTVAQVADRLQLSEVSIRRTIKSGEIPLVRLSTRPGGAVRIPEHELDAWLHSVRTPSNGGGEAA